MLAVGLLVSVWPVPVPADELGVRNTTRGVKIHDAAETLRDYCSPDTDGVLWFVLPHGPRFELVTSIDDPVIVNRGDGAFHPFDPEQVRQALAGVDFPLQSLEADIFILPYPRRGGLQSAAAPELILLSPGVLPLSPAHQHAELVHELGHVIQYAHMPDTDDGRWSQYRQLRGIQDEEVFASSSIHADRPHEIFAEDFRALFGGELATAAGTIENPRLAPPETVGGLARFMLLLGGGEAAPELEMAAYPNPTRGALRFSRSQSLQVPLDLFDVSGRLLVSLAPSRTAVGTEWAWDGMDRSGRRVSGAAVFARARGSREPALRVTLLP